MLREPGVFDLYSRSSASETLIFAVLDLTDEGPVHIRVRLARMGSFWIFFPFLEEKFLLGQPDLELI